MLHLITASLPYTYHVTSPHCARRLVCFQSSVEQMCGLLLQAPRPMLRSLVQQAAESGGKATIMSALLPALQRRLPLHLLRPESAGADTAGTAGSAGGTTDTAHSSAGTPLGLMETLILQQLSETAEVKPFRQLSQLLVAAVGCQLTAVDERLAGRVTALTAPKRLTLHLVQVRAGSEGERRSAVCL